MVDVMGVSLRLEARVILGIVFLFSAAGKLRDPRSFARGVADYQILPSSFAYLVGMLVIPLEGSLAFAHLTGWLLPFASLAGFSLLSSFAAAVGVNLYRGRAVHCYCFGVHGQDRISGRTLARLVLLFLIEAILLIDHGRLTGTGLIYPQEIVGPREFVLAFFWAAVLLVGGVWLLSFSDFAYLLRQPRSRSKGGTSDSRNDNLSTDEFVL